MEAFLERSGPLLLTEKESEVLKECLGLPSGWGNHKNRTLGPGAEKRDEVGAGAALQAVDPFFSVPISPKELFDLFL